MIPFLSEDSNYKFLEHTDLIWVFYSVFVLCVLLERRLASWITKASSDHRCCLFSLLTASTTQWVRLNADQSCSFSVHSINKSFFNSKVIFETKKTIKDYNECLWYLTLKKIFMFVSFMHPTDIRYMFK